MTIRSFHSHKSTVIASLLLVAGLFAVIGRADASQGQSQQNQAPPKEGAPSLQAVPPSTPAAPKLDPEEEAAYKVFFDVSQSDTDKKEQAGEDFLQKYPASRYDEGVYASLVQIYMIKQDWPKFFADADKALALSPDDVSVLTTVGWVIPHTYKSSDPNAAQDLTKAETYEKHAIDVLGTLVKPDTITDEQFATSKTEDLALAHSALGLVYFRRQQYDDSAKELTQATQAAAKPDPTDLYVLGVDLQSLNRSVEAADAYDRCAAIPGGLQGECKRRADSLKTAK